MSWCLPSVLVPSLDLGVGEAELGGQFQPVLDAEVFLALETLLQRLQLVVGERRPGLARFFAQLLPIAVAGRAVVAVVVMMTAAAVSALSRFISIFSYKIHPKK